MFARVLLFQKTGLNADTLTYDIPEVMENIDVGSLVNVPLRNHTISGVLLEKTSTGITKGAMKPIARIIHPCILNSWQMKTLNWLSDEYLAPKWKIARQMIPERIAEEKIILENNRIEKAEDPVVIGNSTISYHLAQDRETILLALKAQLQKHSSGQTIIVTPEISIEPFWIGEIEKEFHAINISKAKTPKQKATVWKEIFEEKYSVIIGSRSALFAPARNLENIIVMNEHDIGHKADQRPKFHTRELAGYIAQQSGANLAHISTSISLAAFHQVTPALQRRIDTTIKWIDMRDERKKHNYSPLSDDLLAVLQATQDHKSQAILFLNKKGSANCLLCKDCGFIPKCKVCERNLVVKMQRSGHGILQCIAGDLVHEIPIGCPRCGSLELKPVGTGQEKIESLLQEALPNAKIMRYSSDTFTTPKEQKKILQDFSDKKIDILITSQLLYSLAPVPQVPVVCAINIDTSLVIPNFQSGEKTLHQLQEMHTHLKPRGLFIIQTYIPETPLLKAYANNTLGEWYKEELATRKTLNYPPWSRIIFLTSLKKDRMVETLDQTMQYLNQTRPHLKIQHAVKMMGHVPKRYLVIRGANTADDLSTIKKMPDITLDFDSPYLM